MNLRRAILNAQRMAAMAVGLALWCVVPATVAAQAPNDAADASMQLREMSYRTNF
jgi:type IV secretory pathway TrbD component